MTTFKKYDITEQQGIPTIIIPQDIRDRAEADPDSPEGVMVKNLKEQGLG